MIAPWSPERVARPRALAAILALSGLVACAVTPDPSKDQWRRAGGDGLEILQIVTREPDQFMADWNRPGTPRLVSSDRVALGRPVVAFIVFRGCRAHAGGVCNLSATFTTTAPDGTIHDESSAMVWEGPPPAGRALELSTDGVGLIVQAPDPLGVYAVSAEVTDHVAGLTLETRQAIQVVANTQDMK